MAEVHVNLYCEYIMIWIQQGHDPISKMGGPISITGLITGGGKLVYLHQNYIIQ